MLGPRRSKCRGRAPPRDNGVPLRLCEGRAPLLDQTSKGDGTHRLHRAVLSPCVTTFFLVLYCHFPYTVRQEP
jgi:hypothetical protein